MIHFAFRLTCIAVLTCFGEWALPAQYSFVNIADNTTTAPIGHFVAFTSGWCPPSISGNVVAFYAGYNDGLQSGIFTGSGGSLNTIAKRGDTTAIGTLQGFTQPTISGNTVAFGAYCNGRLGHFSRDSGPVSPIAIPGDPSPNGTFGFPIGSSPAISGSTFAFLSGGPTQAIFSSNAGVLTTIVRSGDLTQGGVIYDLRPEVSVSGGNVAFIGRNSQISDVIFRGNGDSPTLIVKSGGPAPSGVFQANRIGPPAISDDTVAFAASFGPIETPIATSGWGIFIGKGQGLTPIVLNSDAAPIGTFLGLSDPAISGDTVAFFANYGSGNTVRKGIFTSRGGINHQIIASGNPLFGSLVNDVSIGSYGLDPEGSGNLAFWYSLADGRSGIALALAVPEPATVLILSSCGLYLFSVRGKKGHFELLY